MKFLKNAQVFPFQSLQYASSLTAVLRNGQPLSAQVMMVGDERLELPTSSV